MEITKEDSKWSVTFKEYIYVQSLYLKHKAKKKKKLKKVQSFLFKYHFAFGVMYSQFLLSHFVFLCRFIG